MREPQTAGSKYEGARVDKLTALRNKVLTLLPIDGPVAEAVHITVLCTLVVAQPLWSLIGRSGEFFLARDADAAEVVLAAVAVLIVPPAFLLALQYGAGWVDTRFRRPVHLSELCALALIMLLRVFGRVFPQPWIVVIAAAAGAAVLLAAIVLTRAVRRTVTALAPFPILLLTLFLFSSEARAVVVPKKASVIKEAVEPVRKNPVLFLVFDEFPGTSIMNERLDIDAARVPNIARFAGEATWYRNASTVHDVTDMAVPAILTGRRIQKRVLPVASRYPVNLFSILAKGGYSIRVDEYLTRLCPPAKCRKAVLKPPLIPRVSGELKDLALLYAHDAVPAGFAKHLPPLNGTWGNFLDRPAASEQEKGTHLGGALSDGNIDQSLRIDHFLERMQPARRPTLDYLHVAIPHVPFNRLPSGRRYAPTELRGMDDRGVWSKDPFFADQAQQRNLLQVGYADYQFGRIMDHLRSTGRFDETLIVVVSDHGASNIPGMSRRIVAEESLGDLASVPLLIKLPGQKTGAVDDRSAETIDVLPTIADALGFRVPGRVEGRSLLQPAGLPKPRLLMESRGRRITVPADFPHRHSAVARNYGRFGRNGETLNLFAMGPYRSLVGSPVSKLGPPQTNRLTATFEDSEVLRGSRPPDLSPSRLVGTLSGSLPGVEPGSPLELLISVDGTFVATSRSFELDGEQNLLSIFFPEDAVSRPDFKLEIFAVTGPVETPQLSRVEW